MKAFRHWEKGVSVRNKLRLANGIPPRPGRAVSAATTTTPGPPRHGRRPNTHNPGGQTMRLYNQDCVSGAREHLADNSIDCIITDPPYGIDGDKLDRHYNRIEANVVGGYCEWNVADYFKNTLDWLTEAARVLRPNGTLYIVSGWSRLYEIQHAIHELNRAHTQSDETAREGKPILEDVNHIVWKYNFGVYTTRKFVTSHYHILMLRKVPLRGEGTAFEFTFNNPPVERRGALLGIQRNLEDAAGKPLPSTKAQYRDMEDVWVIPREYRSGEVKNVNQLPAALVRKMIAYSTRPGDNVCDFFLGGFTTAIVAAEMGREPVGFELNDKAYAAFIGKVGG